MAKSRLEWRTESLGSYTGRIADDTPRVARQLVVRGENRLQYQIRKRTPKVTGALDRSILTQHDGRWESVAARAGGMGAAPQAISHPTNAGMSRGRGGWRIVQNLPDAMVAVSVLEGSVYSDLEYAPYVEYDTGRYGPNPGTEPGGRYAIVPRRGKVLVFVIDGRVIFTKKVRHPGSKGKHMFARGAAFVGRPGYMQNQSRDILSAWRTRNSIVKPR